MSVDGSRANRNGVGGVDAGGETKDFLRRVFVIRCLAACMAASVRQSVCVSLRLSAECSAFGVLNVALQSSINT